MSPVAPPARAGRGTVPAFLPPEDERIYKLG